MKSSFLLPVIGSVIAIGLGTTLARAAPAHIGAPLQTGRSGGDLILIGHHGGMTMGHAGMGHVMGAPRFGGPQAMHTMPFHGHAHHHHHRFISIGVPFYDDYGYDYSDSCWWSRRYHRWVCPEY